MSVEVFDFAQGSDEWVAARIGLPTASRFSEILAKGEGKTRAKYLRELAAEKARGWGEPDTFTTVHMERGKEMEGEARALYAFTYAAPTLVGFIRNGQKGCSPDSLVGDAGGLEIKTALGHIQVERMQRNAIPSEHVAQVQGNLWVAEREWWDFMSYSPGLRPVVIRVYRDEAYIAQLAKAVDAFNEELEALVAAVRTYGDFKAQAVAA